MDPAPDKTMHKEAHAKWEVKDAQVMTWIIGSVEPNIVLNLRPFTTVAKMWDYLKKISLHIITGPNSRFPSKRDWDSIIS